MVDVRVLLADDHVAAHLTGPDGFTVVTKPRRDTWYDQEAWRTAKLGVLAHLQTFPECESAERARRWLADRAIERIETVWNVAGRPGGVWHSTAVVGAEDTLLRIWCESRYRANIAAQFPITLALWERAVMEEITLRTDGRVA